MDVLENEVVRLMANFKLVVKRTLQKSVDLEALANNPSYAKKCLAEVEEAAENEELLVMVLRLRKSLVPAQSIEPEPEQKEDAAAKEARNYKFGARAW